MFWRYLKSILQESGWGDIKLTGHHYEDEEPEEWELEDKPQDVGTGKDTILGKYIAKYYGKAGPSGVNVSSDRLMQNFLALAVIFHH